ncbi:MAG: hypothetical protein R3F38_08720 [Gammaproteobacteria bacterium]
MVQLELLTDLGQGDFQLGKMFDAIAIVFLLQKNVSSNTNISARKIPTAPLRISVTPPRSTHRAASATGWWCRLWR